MNRSKSAGVEPANGSIKTSCLNLLATTYNGQPYCPNYPIYVVGHLKLLLWKLHFRNQRFVTLAKHCRNLSSKKKNVTERETFEINMFNITCSVT